ncbi:MAG: hypothetical protein QM754_15545 [Tepidisphaeraceae bacterium]
MNAYPRNVAELDLDSIHFPPAAIDAMRRLARSRPWRGSAEERKQKLLALNAALAAAYGVPAPRVTFGLADERSDRSCYLPALQTIILRGRNLSVISFTHEWFHHLLGSSEHAVCGHSLALFKQCFPRSWARLRFEGHMAQRGEPLGSAVGS